MTDLYLGYPVFIWQALLNLTSLVFAGLLIAFVTTFYLKRKMKALNISPGFREMHAHDYVEAQSIARNESARKEQMVSERCPMANNQPRHRFALLSGCGSYQHNWAYATLQNDGT